MATYTYTGRLTDFGEAPFPTAVPSLWVAPIRPAFGPSGPLADRRIKITVASNGSFSVELVASADLNPVTRYRLRCEWLDGTVLAGWTEWEFTAAIGGGSISNMHDLVVTNVWYSATQPPINRQGIIWIHPTTGDVREWV